jgi:hypothetical protein
LWWSSPQACEANNATEQLRACDDIETNAFACSQISLQNSPKASERSAQTTIFLKVWRLTTAQPSPNKFSNIRTVESLGKSYLWLIPANSLIGRERACQPTRRVNPILIPSLTNHHPNRHLHTTPHAICSQHSYRIVNTIAICVETLRQVNVFTHQGFLRAGSEKQGIHPPMHSIA